MSLDVVLWAIAIVSVGFWLISSCAAKFRNRRQRPIKEASSEEVASK